MLQAKAMLLLRREREVHELRNERSRILIWSKVLHELSLGLHAATPQPLLEKWVDALVTDLTFQVAAVYAIQHSQLHCLHAVANGPLVERAGLSADAFDYLSNHPQGRYDNDEPKGMQPVARAFGLAAFYWLLLPNYDHPLLLFAGCAEGSEHFNPLNALDAAQFALVGQHLAALLHNVTLLAELDREKLELRASNAQLDDNVRQLKETRGQLLQSGKVLAEVSRRAGMADMATGVLHNVGNALNSVNVSSELVARRLERLRLSGLQGIADLLEQNDTEALRERAPKVALYLRELAKHLETEKGAVLDELATLAKHIDHIKAVVSRQQRYAVTFDMAEPVAAHELMEEALTICSKAANSQEFELIRIYQEVPDIHTDRHKVLQILVNFISNAKHALSVEPVRLRQLILRIEPLDRGGVRFCVDDTGVGIAAEDLSQLFRYGFTRRDMGHGFGLHASALFAAELGGQVSGSSAGVGGGASFTLELPAKRAPVERRPSLDPTIQLPVSLKAT